MYSILYIVKSLGYSYFMQKTYDVIVIGAGSGGLTTAVGCRKIGKSVLLVEREHIGGECTNSGCIPSKALLYHAKTYHQAVAIAGISTKSEIFRADAFAYVKRKVTEILALETPTHFSEQGIDVVLGEAIFTNKNTVSINQTSYSFKTAVIATGSSPRLLAIPGLTSEVTLTNQNLFNLDDVPPRTLIVGAGPTGMEICQALALLGSQVTILDNGPTFARLEDSAVQSIIRKSFINLGVSILQNATIERIENNVAHIKHTNSDSSTKIGFDKILIAIGRVPNIPNGLLEAGIFTTESGITVNRNYQTANRLVYALGDVANRLKFTHVAEDVARQVVTRIATRGLIGIKSKAVPKVTYTEPELAQVGLSQREAEERFKNNEIHRIEVPFSESDRARTDNTTDGILIVIVRRLSGEILGAHIAGPRAGELIAIFTLAIDNKISLWKLRRTIYAYPTYALIIKKAGDYFFTTQISTLKLDLLRLVGRLGPKIILGTLWAAGLIALYRYQINQGMSVADTALMIFDFISITAWGPLLYIFAYAIRPITFIPGTVMTILSGIFFGLYGGIIYTIIGANLSATFAYFIGRFFGSKNTFTTTSLFGRLTEACRSNPFTTILTMRLIFLPYDGVNFGAGLLKVPYIPYIIATIIGTLLGIATFVSIGASLSVEEFKASGLNTNIIDEKFLFLSVIVFIASIIVSKFLNRKPVTN